MTNIRERQRDRFYIYKKNIVRRIYIFKKPDTFQKSRQFVFRFYSQKTDNYITQFFMNTLKLTIIYIQKS